MLHREGAKNASSSRNAFGVADDTDLTLREMAKEGNSLMRATVRLME